MKTGKLVLIAAVVLAVLFASHMGLALAAPLAGAVALWYGRRTWRRAVVERWKRFKK